MKYSLHLLVFTFFTFPLISQNDQDAIRYSQTFFGGTNRSKAMAGSFGALGADGSCMTINPAGIGLYKKGDINIGFGLNLNSSNSVHNGSTFTTPSTNAAFNGLTVVGAWDSKSDQKSHHALGLSANQLVNFNSITYIEGNSNHKSITKDMLANAKGKTVANLDDTYEKLGYNTLAIDTIFGKYYSLVNTKYNTIQANEIKKTGRLNEWNINYAYGYDDKFYIGASLGITSVNFSYLSLYSETDKNDSMRLSYNASTKTLSGTYNDGFNDSVYYYTGVGGFKSLGYTESYTTRGTGYNFKIGAIYRANNFIRFGAALATPTFYNLTDAFTYSMTTNFDQGASYTDGYPAQGGIFNYKIITPLKATASVALIYKKLGTLNVDYDIINYGQASLQGSGTSFSGTNNIIKKKYKQTSNLRIGGELVFSPIYIRFGYAMYGSAFGNTFSGNGVNTFFTGGVGYRKTKFYIDLSIIRSQSTNDYYMYNAEYVDKTTIENFGTTLGITIGSKF